MASQLAAKTEQAEGLAEDKANLQTEKSDLLSEKADLVSQVSMLTSEKSSLTSQVSSLTGEKATLTASLAAANARIVHLTNELPFDPREISVAAFNARLYRVLDPKDLIALFAADADPILKQIATTITEWDKKDPIRLDSKELTEPLTYLMSIKLLTLEEVVFLRKDCTRAEAYFATEE